MWFPLSDELLVVAEAVAQYEDVLELHPSNTLAIFNLGKCVSAR